ncbi:hypothetical protein thsrh120_38840 [Rhizobium sp. No.120]
MSSQFLSQAWQLGCPILQGGTEKVCVPGERKGHVISGETANNAPIPMSHSKVTTTQSLNHPRDQFIGLSLSEARSSVPRCKTVHFAVKLWA